MESLRHLLGKYVELSQESLEKLESILVIKNLHRGEIWMQEGEIGNRIAFIEKGLMRSYYHRDKKDITISFSGTGEFISSMSSFISQKPSYESIEALENCILFEFEYERLIGLFEESSQIAHLYRLILERYYVNLEEHLVFSKFKSAKERYLELMEKKPYIIHKASVGQIASYLDMSLETLSRIRATI